MKERQLEILSTSKEMRSFVREVFLHKGRICVVIEHAWTVLNDQRLSELLKPYCNGYVSVNPKNEGKDYNSFIRRIETDELTFSGKLPAIKGWFLGFDSAHYWNDQKPISKTVKFVKEKTKKLAEEMVKKGI